MKDVCRQRLFKVKDDQLVEAKNSKVSDDSVKITDSSPLEELGTIAACDTGETTVNNNRTRLLQVILPLYHTFSGISC